MKDIGLSLSFNSDPIMSYFEPRKHKQLKIPLMKFSWLAMHNSKVTAWLASIRNKKRMDSCGFEIK